ncbi:MAG: hypothetical protein AB7G21_04250 [Dehalococcoidia bacterium]
MTSPRRPRSAALLALAAALAVGLLFVVGLGADGAEGAEPRFSPERPVFSADGLALVVFAGGTFDDLEAATKAAGGSGAWLQDARGNFQVLPVGAPPFYRARLDELFPPAGPGAPNFRRMISVTLVAPD